MVQACNPPDIFWPLARWLRLAGRVAVRVRPPRPLPGALRVAVPARARGSPDGVCSLERATFRTADQVDSTNESYAEIAMRRGRKAPEDVTVVRTGPDPDRL